LTKGKSSSIPPWTGDMEGSAWVVVVMVACYTIYNAFTLLLSLLPAVLPVSATVSARVVDQTKAHILYTTVLYSAGSRIPVL
jgi:hypothetical protein